MSSYSTTSSSALSSFASSYKNATKGLGAFDDYDAKGQAENTLMGISGTAGHFDKYLAPKWQEIHKIHPIAWAAAVTPASSVLCIEWSAFPQMA